MTDALTWTVNQYLLLGITLALFAYMGFRRGVNRELLSMVGIGLGMMVSGSAGPVVAPLVNRLYRVGRFALSGGLFAGDPTTAWASANSLPSIVNTPEAVQSVSLLVFVAVALAFYLLGQRAVPGGKSLPLRVLGLLAGGINGFLASYYLFPLVFSRPRAIIMVPGEQVKSTLNEPQNIALVAVFFVVVLIAFGLLSAGSSRKKS
jgi:uncharacterized membrane protein required for colicin V production